MIIDLYNYYHLGDSIFMMILFYNIKNYIENNNIIINYYCNIEYHKQLNEFICSNNINLLNYTGSENGLNVWIGNTEFEINYFNHNNKTSYNDFYIIFFNQLLNKINIPYKIEYLQYSDPELLSRYDRLNDKYKNIDYLIINSIPLSGQFYYNENNWATLCIELNKKYRIVTTKKVNDILCTLDDNLTVKDIAALSIKVKKIIAVNTGVVPGLLNEYTLNNVEEFYYYDNSLFYSYPKFIKGDINKLYTFYSKDNIEPNIKIYEYFKSLYKHKNVCVYRIILLLLIFIILLFSVLFLKKDNINILPYLYLDSLLK